MFNDRPRLKSFSYLGPYRYFLTFCTAGRQPVFTTTGKSLWQPSYYDHVLRDEEDTWSVARYIVENPLIAGLAERADVYPFLGSATVAKKDLLLFAGSSKPWGRR